jgi:imidazolonepropionase-like amidohydrolase
MSYKFHSVRIVLLEVILMISLMMGCNATSSLRDQMSPASYTITGVAVVDVEQGIVLADQTVIVVGDRIQKIGSRSEVAAPKDSRLIDGGGLYLMPGLVDAHVHYYDPPVFGRAMIANGVLMVRDMGQPTDVVLNLRQELNSGTLLGPEMIATGWILDGDPPFVPTVSLGLKTPEEGRAAVRKQAEAGVDQIKVYSRLEKDVFLAIVDEAKQRGLKPVGHVPESVYVEEAVAAGQRSVEHLHGFDRVIGKLLGEPITLKTGGIGADAHYWPRLAEVNQEKLQKVLRQIRDSGVVICPTVVVFKAGANLKEIQAGKYPMSEYLDNVRLGWATISALGFPTTPS